MLTSKNPCVASVAEQREAARAYRLVALFLAYTGVRFGEMAVVRVGRVDFLRRRA